MKKGKGGKSPIYLQIIRLWAQMKKVWGIIVTETWIPWRDQATLGGVENSGLLCRRPRGVNTPSSRLGLQVHTGFYRVLGTKNHVVLGLHTGQVPRLRGGEGLVSVS